MCHGIAIPIHDLPEMLLAKHRDRIATREQRAGREVQFLYRHPRPLLPVNNGELKLLEWGSRRGPLPLGGFCQREWLDAGLWQSLSPQPATILAALALEKGVWYQVSEGIQGVIVRGHVYMLTEPSSHYYRVMTRSNRMPVFIGQKI